MRLGERPSRPPPPPALASGLLLPTSHGAGLAGAAARRRRQGGADRPGGAVTGSTPRQHEAFVELFVRARSLPREARMWMFFLQKKDLAHRLFRVHMGHERKVFVQMRQTAQADSSCFGCVGIRVLAFYKFADAAHDCSQEGHFTGFLSQQYRDTEFSLSLKI